MMREQHDALEQQYLQSMALAQQGLAGVDKNLDANAFNMQKSYIDELQRAAGELATKGFINSGRRSNINQLQAQYVSKVMPYEQQLQQRKQYADMLYQMKLKDPTFRSTIDPNTVSLDAGLTNPNAFKFDGVSENQMYTAAVQKMEALKTTIAQNKPELMSSGIAFKYFTKLQSGLTPQQASAAMKREGYDPSKTDELTNMAHGVIESTMNEFGVYDKFKGNDKLINEI